MIVLAWVCACVCVCVPCMGLWQHFCISVKLLDYCTSTSWCGVSREPQGVDARHHAVAEMQKAVYLTVRYEVSV